MLRIYDLKEGICESDSSAHKPGEIHTDRETDLYLVKLLQQDRKRA